MLLLGKETSYFEEHYEEYLHKAGMNKAQFAKAMGVLPQNASKLFSTKNALTLARVAEILNVTLDELLFGKKCDGEYRQIEGCVFVDGEPIIIRSKDDIETLLSAIKY